MFFFSTLVIYSLVNAIVQLRYKLEMLLLVSDCTTQLPSFMSMVNQENIL